MNNFKQDYTKSAEYKFAEKMASQFIRGLEGMLDKRPFYKACLGIGGSYVALKSEDMLPDDGFGYVDLGFVPNLTPAELVRALRAADCYGELCIVGAIWFARAIQSRGMNKGDECGYNVCMTLLEDTLKAYFSNQE